MNPVSRPVNIASPNTLKTEDEIALRFGFNSFKFIGKSLRRLTTQPGDWPPGPFATGPGGVGEKPRRMPRFAQAAGQTLQIVFGTPDLRMSAADQPNR